MITVVSGLPRSGTSLMMQMLKAGGMEILTDDIRKADVHNERGYFEYEKVKSIRKDNKWLKEADGLAVKVIAQLLPFLHQDMKYSILYMIRPFDEIISSQRKMRSHLEGEDSNVSIELLEKSYASQVKRVEQLLENSEKIRSLYLYYPEVINQPLEKAGEVQAFLECDLDIEAMASVVDVRLWHQKSGENH